MAMREKDICAVGYSYQHNGLDSYYEIFEAIQRGDDKALASLEFPCLLEIDDPLLIRFDDGDVLGIDFSEGSSIRMELNTLPWGVLPKHGCRNFHADRIFKMVLGRRIIDASITSSLNEPEFTGSHGLQLGKQNTYVRSFALVCVANERKAKSPTWVNLSFESWFDYGHVSLQDGAELLYLPGAYIKEVMEGYLSSEDLQNYLS